MNRKAPQPLHIITEGKNPGIMHSQNGRNPSASNVQTVLIPRPAPPPAPPAPPVARKE